MCHAKIWAMGRVEMVFRPAAALRGSGTQSNAVTIATYVHSQPEALSTAAQSFARVVTNRDNSG
jgi:hypothetical protein